MQIAEAEAQLNALRAEFNRQKNAFVDIAVGHQCPVCGMVVTEENAAAVREEMQKKLSAIVDEGNPIKSALIAARAGENDARAAFEKQKAETLEKENHKLSELNQRLQEMNVARELDREDYAERLSELENRINEQESSIKNGGWSRSEERRVGKECM